MNASWKGTPPGGGESVSKAGLFGLGWACADEAHLPALPQALATLLHAEQTRISITRPDGMVVYENSFEAQGAAAPEAGELAEEIPLADDLTLRVTARAAAFSPAQAEMFGLAVMLMQVGLECILVRQKDRAALGGAFLELSDREWQVCLALQSPNGEKQIANDLGCSRHTVHSYVKGLYRKMRVRSRLLVLEQLRKSREEVRCGAVARFAAAVRGRTRNNGGQHLEPAAN